MSRAMQLYSTCLRASVISGIRHALLEALYALSELGPGNRLQPPVPVVPSLFLLFFSHRLELCPGRWEKNQAYCRCPLLGHHPRTDWRREEKSWFFSQRLGEVAGAFTSLYVWKKDRHPVGPFVDPTKGVSVHITKRRLSYYG